MGYALNWLSPKWDSRFGRIVFAVYVTAQCLDGISTYIGVTTYGIGVERNPLIAWFMSIMGVGLGLVVAKLIGLGAGLFLCRHGFYGIVMLLTIFYLIFAVFPWIHIFLTR